MFKTLTLAALATVALTSFAEAQQRGYGYQQRGGGYGQRGGYNQVYRGGGNYNNSFNRNVYVKNNGWGGGGGWAAAGAGLAVGALLGAAIAQPAYAAPVYAPAPQYVAPVYPPANVVPGCYNAMFVDQYGRQFMQQICN